MTVATFGISNPLAATSVQTTIARLEPDCSDSMALKRAFCRNEEQGS